MEHNPSCLPDDAVHMSGFGGDDAGVMELDAMSQVDTVIFNMVSIERLLCPM
jgi:hypothetical protein